jgi:hypothetical protein
MVYEYIKVASLRAGTRSHGTGRRLSYCIRSLVIENRKCTTQTVRESPCRGYVGIELVDIDTIE